MGIGPRTKGDIKTSIKKHAYPKPTHKPPPNLVEFWAFKRSPILVEYSKDA
jgi:hypothetical protein